MASSALLSSTALTAIATTSSSPSPHRYGVTSCVLQVRARAHSFQSGRASQVSSGSLQAVSEQSRFGCRGIESDWSLGAAASIERTRRRGVVCEVAVELGGSRSGEGEETKNVEAGTRIRITGPLKVYHVPKTPELDIGGMEGEVKDVVTTYKGKPISATFPYKVQLTIDGEDKKIKFFVHLKEDEFEVLQ